MRFGRMATIAICFFLLLSLCGGGFQRASAEDMPMPQSFRHVCVPAKGEKNVPVLSYPKNGSEQLLRLAPGDTLTVLGISGKYYAVQAEGRTGYVAQDRVRLQWAVRQEEIGEQILGNVRVEDPIPKVNTNYLALTGKIECEKPLDTLFAYFWDERQFRVEYGYIKALDQPSASIDAGKLKSFIALGQVTAGRKTLVIQGASAGETFVLFRSPVYIRGAQEEPSSVTGLCRVPSDALLDTKLTTTWKPTQNRPSLAVDISREAEAAFITLEWQVIPASFRLELYDENNACLLDETVSSGRYYDWKDLPDGTRRAVITPSGAECALSTLRVYSNTYSTHAVQRWQDTPEKLDLLVVSTHQDDELLFLGGAIPYYAHQDVKMAVLFMTDCSRMRMREGLDGLWTAGLKYYPICLGLEDQYSLNTDQALARWNKFDPQTSLVRALRQYRPEVILCQDFEGEYGHGQHKATVKMLAEALPLAADAAYDPESFQEYGVWQVKKMYSHLYPENQIIMDWDQPLDDSGVITPRFLAVEAYDKHRTQHAYFSMEKHGQEYDNTVFGLYYTAVGPDVEKNDFLEHIDRSR